MKYKVGDRFLSERKIVDIDISRSTPYLLMGCGSGWMSEKYPDVEQKMRFERIDREDD